MQTSGVTSAVNTPNELPIACSLGAGDLAARYAELAALGERSLVSVARSNGAAALLRFKNDPATKAELERIVAAESECCAFLEMRIADGDLLKLAIDGPEGAGPFIDDLVSAFVGTPP